MNTVQVDINSLKPYKNNPRNNDNAVSAVANSIREFGFKVPIVIDSDHVIVAGHTRLKAAQTLGLSTVPCVVADDLTGEQIKAFRLADNKVSELADWDIDLLTNELELLESIDMSDFGFEKIDNEYQQFVEKFEPKLTTDDCYTPESVYSAVLDWTMKQYKLSSDTQVIRPFYPGENYQAREYPRGCVVVDNPPFSIMTEILNWFNERDIKYLLFAPALTSMHLPACKIYAGDQIRYENGATVNTCFVTNLDTAFARTAPDLQFALNKAQSDLTEKLPSYSYPDELLTATDMQKLCLNGFEFVVERAQMVRRLDAQVELGKGVFGAGALISSTQAQAKVDMLSQIEKLTHERRIKAMQGKLDNSYRFELSDREHEIVKGLSND